MKMPYEKIILSNVIDENTEYIPVVAGEDDKPVEKKDMPDILPILPLRNTVLFPGVILPISIGRDKSLKLIRDAYAGNKLIGTITQKDSNIEEPQINDIFSVGSVAKLLRILEMPDDTTTVILQGKARFRPIEYINSEPYLTARVELIDDIQPDANDSEFEAIIGSLKDLSIRIIKLSANIPPEASFAIKNIINSSFLINFISSNSDIKPNEKQELLEIDELKKRASKLLQYLSLQLQMLELRIDIQKKVKTDMDKMQKEFLLQQQMKQIQEELGGNTIEKELDEMKIKAAEKNWSKEVKEVFDKEYNKLQRMNPSAAEYSMQMNYIQTLLELPWNIYTTDNFDLKNAEKILNRDHYGLEKIKERILEHLAVLKLKGDMKSPILCLYGPPGVGKTSLGKSIAEALGRNYVRMSLGGLHDEAEIRGHRKTYIGAMPGRIIQNIKRAKSSNPVFILDEIDKVGQDFRGDPSSALLEALDPEQNNAFYDNYLELEYDLSKVMFIATANVINTIHPALRDRMEMINISGYIVDEKIEIAQKHLVPKQLEAHGLKNKKIKFTNDALEYLIDNYTRESGVRELDKKLATIIRRIAKKVASNEKYSKNITKDEVQNLLGAPEYFRDKMLDNKIPGIVTGLAWTQNGGEILFIESSLSKGEGKLTLTGNLGDVMKESAILAFEYIKAHAENFNINPALFKENNIHIHVPEGAIPKDGPSAGIAMATSIVSIFTGNKVKKDIAMTGEITLRGKVLPVGGIKEKILAAKRANIKEIILSKDNKKDIDEINSIYLKGLQFHYVDEILDVIDIALISENVKNRK